MTQVAELVVVLKAELKRCGLTYAEIAKRLDMSEANIKRLFASKRFTLERLAEICQLIDFELSDLFQLYDSTRQRISQLSVEQEEELVGDYKLLLVAVSVRNQLSFEEIVHHYAISETECIRCLARLDRLRIIDLLPNNRIRLRIADNFAWLAQGPIERFYEQQIQTQFLRSRFIGDEELRQFVFGLLSDASINTLLAKMKLLAKELSELHRQDSHLPLEKRHSVGMMLAMRPWELEVLQKLRKADK